MKTAPESDPESIKFADEKIKVYHARPSFISIVFPFLLVLIQDSLESWDANF